MVPSRGDESLWLGAILVVEDRHDHGDVGKVSTPTIGIVEHIGIAAPEAATVTRLAALFYHAGDTVAHAA